MPRIVPPVVAPGGMRGRSQPTLVPTMEIELRPWVAGDMPALLAAFEDPAIRHWHMRRIDSADEAREWIAGWADRWEAETDAGWAAVERGSGELLGQAALRTANLAFGYAQITGLHRLTIHHSAHNEASCRVAARVGFPLEGTMRSALLHDDGWHDMHVHARVADQD